MAALKECKKFRQSTVESAVQAMTTRSSKYMNDAVRDVNYDNFIFKNSNCETILNARSIYSLNHRVQNRKVDIKIKFLSSRNQTASKSHSQMGVG